MQDPLEKICGRRLIIFAKGCIILLGTARGMGEAVVPFQWKELSSLGLLDGSQRSRDLETSHAPGFLPGLVKDLL